MFCVRRSLLPWLLAATGIAALASNASAQQAPPPAAGDSGASGDLDPSSPMADMPDLGVDWPDMDAAPPPADSKPDSAAAQIDPGLRTFRYSFKLEGVDDIADALFRQRFNEGSVLKANDGDSANAAQIDRRAHQDADLLLQLLRAAGYYDARVRTQVDPEGDRLLVTLRAAPGQLYRFADVDLAGLGAAGDRADDLRRAFPVKKDDPVDADAVATATDRLRAAIHDGGFPFADVGAPRLVVDHDSRTATLSLDVQPGGERRFGRIVTTDNRVFGGDHIADIARFRPGDLYDQNGVEDLKRALIQTGLVSSVKVTPVEGAAPGTVDLSVAMEPAPPRTIAGEIGYGTGEGARIEGSWSHRNFVKPEGALTIRGVLGTREYLGSASLRFNNFHARDRVLTGIVAAAHTERDAYIADTFTLSGTLERQSNIFFQKKWAWSIGAELVASDERDVIAATGQPRRRTFFIGALPTSLTYDGTDDLLNPTHGFRLGGRFSPEVSLNGGSYAYARMQVDASVYQPVNDRIVLAARTRIGSIAGAPADDIAPSRRFYAGGGASVRGYGYQNIGPRDANNDPIGGRSLAEFSIEARVKAFGNFGVVPFIDAGNIYTSSVPKFTGFRVGAGVGVRYYTNFGPIRVDVGTPINPQPGDPKVAVYVSLGQAF